MTLLIKTDRVQEQSLPKHKYTVEEFEQLFAEAEHGDRLLELIHGEIVENPLKNYAQNYKGIWDERMNKNSI